jgi:tRNA G18 (ribose-2'-O)-methylase SpoU
MTSNTETAAARADAPIKLLKGIPLPKRHSAPREQLRKTFAKMQIGVSFDIASDDINRGTLYRMADAAGIKIAVSAIRNQQKELSFYRVWRVE